MPNKVSSITGTGLTRKQYAQRLEWVAAKLEDFNIVQMLGRSGYGAVKLRGDCDVGLIVHKALNFIGADVGEYFQLHQTQGTQFYSPATYLGIGSVFDWKHNPVFWGVTTSRVPLSKVSEKLREVARVCRVERTEASGHTDNLF